MRSHARPLLLALLALAALAVSVRADGKDLEKYRASVVQVFITSQSEDYSRPWQRPRAYGGGGSAFYIGDRMLLTNAHVVSDSKLLLVKRADGPKRYEARVLFVGHDCDLAVMTVDDPAFFEGMEPLRIGVRPEMQSTVATVGYPMGGNKLSITEGVVSRIEVRGYSHTRADEHLTIQIDAAINPGNSGGPVIQDGKVVGVAFQGQFFAQNIGYMIPPSVINHFLEDIRDSTYHGYPELGVYTAKLENDSLRRYLGVPDGETGVLVLKPTPYASAVGSLRRNDVITKIDGKLIEVPIRLKGWGARMAPSIQYDRQPEYKVIGGYVFVPVTTNYLMRSRASEELSFYYQQYYRMVAEEGKTREQLVLLSRVLPHPSTRYRSYSNAIVAKVDGVVPRDFRHFVSLLEGSKKPLVKIDFEGVNTAPLILDREQLAKVHDDICKRYGITEDEYVEETTEK